ncbi:MAG: endonuclease/exonuclease/phosphatase family protein [Verrucomicrobia bacterium]|jgi:endonuclease/exonuclease/phosphatase family metal-dependent hydrolase|nr:endonuclease/exonuclease/phosphatase family protein [Verrucomicrobiota bacterium]
MIGLRQWLGLPLAGVCLLLPCFAGADSFRVATYNVENFLDQPTDSRAAKSAAAKARVCDQILALKPDVLALQEIGTRSALQELQSALRERGCALPHAEWVDGWDTNIHVAVLSRFPFTRQSSHTNAAYLLSGRRLHVSRGFAEVDIQVNRDYSFTLLVAHLKSKLRVGVADEAEMRLEEAKLLRQILDRKLEALAPTNFLVCGDFNDTYNSPPLKTLVGRGRRALTDTRPAERNGDPASPLRAAGRFPRTVTWTHYYGAEDTYSRIDYILLSPGMTEEWSRDETWVLTAPNWGLASDHRPLVATFTADDQ